MLMREYLCREARRIQADCLRSLPPVEQWAQERQRRLQQYYDMMGVADHMAATERPPLNVQVTGEVARPGYRIQKLCFEALPRLYVTANLYLPDGLAAPAPGVVYLCGHSTQQKVHYQAHPRRFAQLGFVCLIVETIQRGEIEGHHHGTFHRGWFNWYSRGYTPAGVEFWNSVRALDLLQSRPEVDGSRLGVTGLSGGGAGSWFLAAGDERVRVAAPVCGTATFASHVCERTLEGHCDCMFPVNVYGWELADLAPLIAPRPLLIGAADRDAIFHIRSIRDVYATAEKVYAHLGAADNVRLVETPGGHSYHATSRRAIFSWFLRHLCAKDVPEADVDDIDERPEAQESTKTLQVYASGVPGDERTSTIQDEFVRLARPPGIRTAEQLTAARAEVIASLKARTLRHFPVEPCPLDVQIEYEMERPGLAGGRFAFTSEAGWRLHGMWFIPHAVTRPGRAVVAIRSPHEERRATETWLEGLDPSWARVVVEVRGTGDTAWGPGQDWYVRRAAMLTGRTVASMQVYDALRALEAVSHLPGIAADRLALAGRDGMAAVALYAALLDGRMPALLLDNPPATQDAPSHPDGTGLAIEMLHCLQITDLPQVAGLLWPTELVFTGPRPATYQWAEDLYARLGAPGAVRHVMQWSQWRG